MNKIDRALLTACRKVRRVTRFDITGFISAYGICYSVKRKLPLDVCIDCMVRLDQIMQTWPEYSGDKDYPVRHGRCSSYHAYLYCDRWTIFTQYGRARRRLLNYIIATLEQGN